MQNIQTQITQLVQNALTELNIPFDQEIKLEHPGNPDHGEWSSTVALVGFRAQKLQSATGSNKGSNSNVGKDSTLESKGYRLQTSYQSPRDLAQAIADEMYRQLSSNPKSLISTIEVAGPGFINFYLSDEFYLAEMGKLVRTQLKPGKQVNTGKLAIVEFSSPNIAKPFTIGHLRSTIIGNAVANLLEATGYTVMRDNHLGDWGTQFGKLIYAIKNLGEGSEEKNIAKISSSDRPVKELVDLYVEFHAKAEEQPELEDEGRRWFKKLEDGDHEARSLWQKCIDWSWVEFNKIYQQLGITFSPELNQGRGLGESFFEDKMDAVIEELVEKKIMTEGEGGAKLVFFPDEKLPPLMIVKKDGATLYATRDLATDKYRKEQWNPDLIVNEVGGEQALYFRQIFETEKMLGWFNDGQRVHVKHGLYRFKDKKMSTRKGNVIWLEDVIAEAVKRAESLAKNKTEDSRISSTSTGLEDAEMQSEGIESNHQSPVSNHELIGIGALKWNDLRRSSELDIVFDWDEMLSMEGNSGPYMQYTYVRTHSILQRFKKMQDNAGFKYSSNSADRQVSGYTEAELQSSKLAESHSEKENTESNLRNEKKLESTDYKLQTNTYHPNQEERTVLRKLARYEETVLVSAAEYSPHVLCTYLYELAQAFNSFYAKHSILGDQSSSNSAGVQVSDENGKVAESQSEGSASNHLPLTTNLQPPTITDQLAFRLQLTQAVAITIQEGLRLLGIAVVEEM